MNQTRLNQYGMDLSNDIPTLQAAGDEALAQWLKDEALPFSLVESPGLKKFLGKVSPHYKVCNRRAIRRHVLFPLVSLTHSHHHQIMKQDQKETGMILEYFLAFPETNVACCLDLWKSRAGQHYLGVVVTFITLDWKMQSVCLGMIHVEERHTAENITALTQNILKKYNIIPFCYVADNATNQVLSNDLLADWSDSQRRGILSRITILPSPF